MNMTCKTATLPRLLCAALPPSCFRAANPPPATVLNRDLLRISRVLETQSWTKVVCVCKSLWACSAVLFVNILYRSWCFSSSLGEESIIWTYFSSVSTGCSDLWIIQPQNPRHFRFMGAGCLSSERRRSNSGNPSGGSIRSHPSTWLPKNSHWGKLCPWLFQ